MNLISRHLPPLRAEDSRVPLLGKVILLGILALIGYWIYSSPQKATIGLGAFAALIGGAMLIEGRRVARIRQERDETVGDFVMFFTHQPKTRQAEQGGTGGCQASTLATK